jgi:hypothetical protein
METGTKIKNKNSGDIGYVVEDLGGILSVAEDNEVMVVYEGTTYASATNEDDIEIIGKYEAIPDPKKCGAGRGKECCIFLTVGSNGFNCERFSSMRNSLIFRTMNSERSPAENYPDCMKF